MSIKVSRAASFLGVAALIIVALVILAPFPNSAAATSPIPTPPPTVHYTDAGVDVLKEETITTQQGVTSTHVMQITVMNSGYPATIHLTILAVSHLNVCEARLIPVGGDLYTEFVTDEDNNSVNETLYSEIDLDLVGMFAGETRVLQRSYSLVCITASPPATPYEIQVDVLPLLPIQESNLGNPPTCPSPWCVPGTAGGPQTSSDNVHKNFPHITINVPQEQCVGTPPWPVPAGDTDCDGYASALEAFVGTNPGVACGSDAWPVDFNNDRSVNMTDVFNIVPHLNTTDDAPGSSPRFDLNGNGSINLSDAFKVVPVLNQSC